MINISSCRKILASRGVELSQKEIEQLRANLYQLASIFIKQYLNETKDK